MEDFRVVPHDMSTAAGETGDAASDARGRDSASHLPTAASAVPGAQSVALVGELGDGWRILAGPARVEHDGGEAWCEVAPAATRRTS